MKKQFTSLLLTGCRNRGFIQKASLTFAIFTFLFFFSLINLSAQPTINWENTIRATEEELFAVARQTTDGGYILGGTSISNAGLEKTSNLKGSADYWVVKLNATGVQQWDKTLGGDGSEILYSVKQTADKGYILAGTSDSNASGDKSENNYGMYPNTWIVKLDEAGTKQWDKSIPDAGTIIEQTPDGGYVLSGENKVIKLNSAGGVVWSKVFAFAGSLQQTTDNGFVLVGYNLAVKLDAAGTILWEQPLSGAGNLTTFKQTADGGYIMGGQTGEDYYVLKLNAAGTKEWDKTVGGLSTDWFRTLIQTSDGGYILGGDSHSGAGGDKTETNKGPLYFGNNYYYKDYWIVKLDAAGNRIWDKTIGGIFHEELRSLEQTADGGLVIGGRSDSYSRETSGSYAHLSDKAESSSNFDYWVVKLSNVNDAPETNLCKLALTSKVTQAEPWFGMWPGGYGSIDITVIGGTPPYTYRWNTWNPGPFEDYPNANPGLHTVIVTDAQGCTLGATFEVGKKNDPMRLHTSHTNLSTDGDLVGSIDLTVVGGTVPYKYSWSNGATTEDLINLPAGTYTVTVSDPFGKTATTSVTITNPRTPTCNLIATSKVTQAEPWYGMWGPTYGAGSIDVTPSGGTAPYTYQWNTGATTEDLAVVAPGVYSVIITDAQACTTTTTVTVGRKNAPMSLTASHTNVTTTGGSNGSIDLTVVGGTVPYKYRWSNGATTEDLTNLPAGTYTVNVSDPFGKTATLTVQVLGPGQTTVAAGKAPTQIETFISKKSSLTVYPTPVKEKSTVEFKLDNAGKYTLDLYDLRGSKVKTLSTGQGQTQKGLAVDINAAHYAEGIYLLRLVTDKGIETKRISILR